ncbi:hypothetical protein [Peribacillus simplex]|uniref:hypothetical protein n=1 Tax=Peribacillus simplex TaxID=1478 RepID=UPI003D29E28A
MSMNVKAEFGKSWDLLSLRVKGCIKRPLKIPVTQALKSRFGVFKLEKQECYVVKVKGEWRL